MPGVGEPAGIGAVGERRGDLLADRHTAERHIARCDALGEGHQVGHHVEVVDGEPLAGPAEAGHHLVGDEHDAVAVADLPDPGHVTGWGDHDARGARHRLEDDGRDRVRPLVLDQPIQVVQRPLGLLLLGLGVERRPVQERAVEVHDTAAAVVVGVAARVAGQVDRGVGAAVIGAVTREHLAPAGVQPGHPDRVLDRVGAAVCEEHLGQVAGRALGDQPGRLGPGRVGVLRRDRAQLRGLFGNGRNDFRMLVADVGEHQLRGEVEIPVSLAVPDVGALGGHDRHRGDLGLRRPGVEDVFAVQLVGLGGLGDRRVEGLPARQHLGSCRRHACHLSGQLFCGKPRLMPPWEGSSQRVVTTLPRVKKCTPSAPCAWVSPNSELFQPPKL